MAKSSPPSVEENTITQKKETTSSATKSKTLKTGSKTASGPKKKTTAKAKAAAEKKPKSATKTKRKTSKKTKASKTSKTTKTAKAKSSSKTKLPKVELVNETERSEQGVAVKTLPPILGQRSSILKRNPLGHLLIEKMLREEGFKGGVTTSKEVLDKFSTDESIFTVKPQVVIQPKNRHDVEVVTKIIARETKRFDSLSLTPRANGTGFDGSALTDSVVVDMAAHLNNVTEVIAKKEEIIFSAEAGASWREIEKKLKVHNAALPPCATLHDVCAVGGAVSCNAGGPSPQAGLCSDLLVSLDMVLSDGHIYTIKPLTYSEYKSQIKEKHVYAKILTDILALLKKYEKENSVGSAEDLNLKIPDRSSFLKILPQGVEAFTKGEGVFDLTKFVAGSQGTIGIIVSVKMRALREKQSPVTFSVPIFQLDDMPGIIAKINKYKPLNFEIFDNKTFDNALKSPNFFKRRLEGLSYYRSMLSLYTSYHVRYAKRTPEFTLVATMDKETISEFSTYEIITDLNTAKTRARLVTNSAEVEMLRQLNLTYYTLSKLENNSARPATFLKPVSVPIKKLTKFITDVRKVFKELNVQVVIHGDGHNSSFSFYPQLNFTEKTTALLIEKLAERFYVLVDKYDGTIHEEVEIDLKKAADDTPHRSANELDSRIENIFDPDDIFNPGKKTFPRFNIRGVLRTTN